MYVSIQLYGTIHLLEKQLNSLTATRFLLRWISVRNIKITNTNINGKKMGYWNGNKLIKIALIPVWRHKIKHVKKCTKVVDNRTRKREMLINNVSTSAVNLFMENSGVSWIQQIFSKNVIMTSKILYDLNWWYLLTIFIRPWSC